MKASELIEKIIKIISIHGDTDIGFEDSEFGYFHSPEDIRLIDDLRFEDAGLDCPFIGIGFKEFKGAK